MENSDVARIFEEMADLLEVKGANPFRIRSFRNAAYAVQDAPRRVTDLSQSDLTNISGIGKGIAGRILEIAETGTCQDLHDLRDEVPVGLLDILKLNGVGPKRARLFWKELGIESVDALEAAASSEKLRELEGMGKKSEEKILKSIDWFRDQTGRFRLGRALPIAESMVERLEGLDEVDDVCYCGSLRRRKDTIGDVDILVTCDDADAVFDHLLKHAGSHELLGRGETKTSIRLDSGLQIDVRVVPAESFGAALHYFTGSKAHNVAIRDRAKRDGLRVNEYGVFRTEDGEELDRVGGDEESDIFEAVGLPWIPPELRENAGEIDAAAEGRLPSLIAIGDIRGDLQMHSTWSDGKRSIREMALHARNEMKYDYVAITDHSKAVAMTGGLDEKRLKEQWEEIDELNEDPDLSRFRILKSIECDILADGSLDLDEKVLREADVVLGCIHYQQQLPRAEQTQRYVTAIESGLVDIIGHPTGRLIGSRGPMELDMDTILEACAEHQVALEINANPKRLDLRDVHARQAKELGCRIVISTDAHSPDGMQNMRFGVYTARRGWIEKEDVLNAHDVGVLLKFVEERGRKAAE